MSTEQLFNGEPMPLGGLSNEEKLAKLCPDEFQRGNPWSDYAMTLFYRGGKISNWSWKSYDDQIKGRQMACFKGLLGSFGVSHEGKTAVAGWMLSEMLTEVPEHIETEQTA